MSEIAKAYVQIIPTAQGISGSLGSILDPEAESAGRSAGGTMSGGILSSLSDAIKTAGKVGAIAIGAASGAVGALAKEAVASYAEYEQLAGGVETLFKGSSETVMKYAENAYKTAGMTANQYMETVTGFSASLLQGLGGNTEEAARVADMAITDMADNANKMGTSMESIENAYQGFAKQNYTMLDNLKLGYGGTKSEMERLLADAEALTGIHYDIGNLSDVYSAIHVIQQEVGITGTTAAEAESTISGSLGQLKAAWGNLVTGFANDNADLGALISEVVGTAETAFGNILPVAEQALVGIADFVTQIAPVIQERLPGVISELLPHVLEAATSVVSAIVGALPSLVMTLAEQAPFIVSTLVDSILALGSELWSLGGSMMEQLTEGLSENGEELFNEAASLAQGAIDTLFEFLPGFLEDGTEFVGSIAQGVLERLPFALETVGGLAATLVGHLLEFLPDFLDTGANFVLGMIEGIGDTLPDIIETIGSLAADLLDRLFDELPNFLEKGGEFILNMINGIVKAAPDIIKSIGTVAVDLLSTLAKKLPDFLKTGISFIGEMAAGLIRAIPDILRAIPEIIGSVIDEFARTDWLQVGIDIIRGIAEGVGNAGRMLLEAVESVASWALDAIKSLLGIGSPSKVFRDEVGRWIPEGLAVGIEGGTDSVKDAIGDVAVSAVTGLTDADIPAQGAAAPAVYGGSSAGQTTINVYQLEGEDPEALARRIASIINTDVARHREAWA